MKPRYIIFIIIGALVILGIIIAIFGVRPPKPTETTVSFWGFEDPKSFSTIFSRLKDEQKIVVNYSQKSRQNFKQELLEAMANGTAPDIFQLNHQELTQYKDKITPSPTTIFTLQNYQSRFTDLVFGELANQQGIWAVPLYLDTLALFYNKDFFNSMAIPQAPTTWEAFKDAVVILSQKDERDNVLRPGCAWGTGSNVSHSADLLAALMIQSGAKMLSDDKKQALFDEPVRSNEMYYEVGQKALEFYTDFADVQKEVYTWNRRMSNSLEVFSQAKAAMAFGYSQDYFWLKKTVPYLNFGVAPFPQIAQADFMVNYADYDILVAYNRSAKSSSAWQAMEFLTQPEKLKTYLTQAKRPTPVRELVNWQKQNLDLGVFSQQALSGRSWYQADPKAVEEIFIEMIDAVVLKELEPEDALEQAANKVTQTLR